MCRAAKDCAYLAISLTSVGDGAARKMSSTRFLRCGIEGGGRLPAFQSLDTFVEPALEPIDGRGIEIFKPFGAEHLIKPVLTFDEKVQPALAIVDVERQQKPTHFEVDFRIGRNFRLQRSADP